MGVARIGETEGKLMVNPTIEELAEQEKQRAEQERQRAEQAELELKQEQIYRQRLVQKLKELGVNPENL